MPTALLTRGASATVADEGIVSAQRKLGVHVELRNEREATG